MTLITDFDAERYTRHEQPEYRMTYLNAYDKETLDKETFGKENPLKNVTIQINEPNLIFENVDFSLSTFEWSDLRNAIFHKCNLLSTTFYQVNLRGATFIGCNMQDTAFQECRMSRVTIACQNFTHFSFFESIDGVRLVDSEKSVKLLEKAKAKKKVKKFDCPKLD